MAVLQGALESSKCDSDVMLAWKPVIFFMYFDEAQTLTTSESIHGNPDEPPPLSRHRLLEYVLGRMINLPFFTFFLSTNPRLGAPAPSRSRSSHRPTFRPSIVDWGRVVVHPPFTELPFDTFAADSFATLSKMRSIGVKLQDVCNLQYVVKFGRPL